MSGADWQAGWLTDWLAGWTVTTRGGGGGARASINNVHYASHLSALESFRVRIRIQLCACAKTSRAFE